MLEVLYKLRHFEIGFEIMKQKLICFVFGVFFGGGEVLGHIEKLDVLLSW
jgi:hypothetical protein